MHCRSMEDFDCVSYFKGVLSLKVLRRRQASCSRYRPFDDDDDDSGDG